VLYATLFLIDGGSQHEGCGRCGMGGGEWAASASPARRVATVQLLVPISGASATNPACALRRDFPLFAIPNISAIFTSKHSVAHWPGSTIWLRSQDCGLHALYSQPDARVACRGDTQGLYRQSVHALEQPFNP
jgi:hypothetical protein